MLWTDAGTGNLSGTDTGARSIGTQRRTDQREIAEKLHIKPPTVNVTVQRLEKAGFLYREADEKDQRISRIYMTEKGKQAKESGMKKVQDNEKILLDGFSEEDLCLLRRFLDQITENIEKIPVASGKNNTRKERQQK